MNMIRKPLEFNPHRKRFYSQYEFDISRVYYQALGTIINVFEPNEMELSGLSPIELLKHVKLDYQRHHLPLLEESVYNAWLGQGTSLGLIAQMAALMELVFKNPELMISEIKKSNFVPYLLHKFEETNDEHFLQDVLFVESHQLVLQFMYDMDKSGTPSNQIIDPLSEFVRIDELPSHVFEHELMPAHPAWETITAAKLANQMLVIKDFDEAKDLYQKAEDICPGLLITKRAWCLHLKGIERYDDALEQARIICDLAPTAENLFLLFRILRPADYQESRDCSEKLEEEYSRHIWPLLQNRFGDLL